MLKGTAQVGEKQEWTIEDPVQTNEWLQSLKPGTQLVLLAMTAEQHAALERVLDAARDLRTRGNEDADELLNREEIELDEAVAEYDRLTADRSAAG
jgi:hypothetical protein